VEGQKVWLHGRPVDGSEITVPPNRPIDLSMPVWIARERKAVASDGSAFAVTIAPALESRTPARVAVLVDHSGSMNEAVSLHPGRGTKHQAVKRALAAAAKSLLAGDRLAVWEFDDAATPVGIVNGPRDGKTVDVSAIERLSDPHGGTEIDGALEQIIAEEPESDIHAWSRNSLSSVTTAIGKHKLLSRVSRMLSRVMRMARLKRSSIGKAMWKWT
jgi:hypothetical protein